MDSINKVLGDHPVLGIRTSIGGSTLPFLDLLSPILSVAGMIIGILIGIVTLKIKLKEWKKVKGN